MSRRLLLATCALALGTCACSDSHATVVRIADRGAALEALSDSGAQAFVRRIDGQLLGVQSSLGATTDARQWVLSTGPGAGTDQASVIVLAEDGELLVRHRVSGDSPEGSRLLYPHAASTTGFQFGGRRYVAIRTAGMFDPYSVEFLEAPDPRTLRHVHTFWNPGAIDRVIIDGRRAAIDCLANQFRKTDDDAYPIAVAVIDLAAVLRSNEAPTGTAPSPTDAGRGYERYFVFPEFAGEEHETSPSVRLTGDTLLVDMGIGYAYRIDIPSAAVSVERNAPEVDVDQSLAARVLVFPR